MTNYLSPVSHLQQALALKPAASIQVLQKTLERQHLARLYEEHLGLALTSKDLFYANDWVEDFFSHIDDNHFPLEPFDDYEAEEPLFSINATLFMPTWEEYEAEENNLFVWQFMIARETKAQLSNPQANAALKRMPALHYSQITAFHALFASRKDPLRHIPLVQDILRRATGNYFWDTSYDNYESLECSAENITALTTDYQTASMQNDAILALNEWLVKKGNLEKFVNFYVVSFNSLPAAH